MSRWAVVARAVRFHRRLLSCLVLLARRQQDGVPAGATALRHDRAGRPVGLLLLGMSVVELAAFELLVPWRTLRLVLLVLGGYSLLAVLGLLAAEAVRPHVVTGRHLLLRSGLSAQVRVPLDAIVSARAVLRTHPPSGCAWTGRTW